MSMDGRGEMGFNESVIAIIVVVTILSLYAVFLAGSLVERQGVSGDLDIAVDVDINGTVSVSESSMCECIASMDINGIRVDVTIPGFEELRSFQAGDLEGIEHSKTLLKSMPYLNGRVVPVLIEVVTYG